MPRRAAALLLLVPLLLSGCATTTAQAPSDGRIRVVASTDVWGDVVRQVGGDAVQVDSLITDPERDPHEYQSDPRDQLAVSRAQLVVENGGGYDDFLSQLLKNAPESTVVLNVAERSGLDLDPADGEFNEHLWYDFPVVAKVAGDIAAELTKLDPARKSQFADRLKAFTAEVDRLEAEAASIKRSAEGKGVAITEPVPLYLTGAIGLVNRTPAEFSEAIEEGDDVAPAVLQQQLALFTQRKVVVLAYNEQTSTSTTERVLAAAKAAGVAVVPVRETLPDGQDWVEWMQNDLDQLKAAVTT